MRKNIKVTLTLLGFLLIVVGCSKKVLPLSEKNFTADPNPLEVNGGKINAKIMGVIPQKYLSKNAILTITPVLKYYKNSIKGTPFVLQGEKVTNNYPVVPYKAGKNISIPASFFYNSEMNNLSTSLLLKLNIKQKKKTYQLPTIKVAEGINTTSQCFSTDVAEIAPAVAPNYFKRITKEAQEADILFLIQQARLRKSELKKESILNFERKLREARYTVNKNIDEIKVLGYASPDGSLEINQKLAEKRQNITQKYIDKELQKLSTNVHIDTQFTAEDWEGFQKLLKNSDIQDKELILRVLSMYDDPEEREREIKNLSETFKEVANEILPQLRRARLKLLVNVKGKSDQEIRSASILKAHLLTAEELLYAGTLVESDRFKTEIYQKFINKYPNDARGYINLGTVEYELGNLEQAEKLFQKALKIDIDNPNANFNLGLVQLKKGSYNNAEQYFGKSGKSTGNIAVALGTTYIAKGNYQQAEKIFAETKSNNAVLAQILNKNYNKAEKTISKIENPNALTSYLSAIISARTHNKTKLYDSLIEVARKDKILFRKAYQDIEFFNYLKNKEFNKYLKKQLGI